MNSGPLSSFCPLFTTLIRKKPFTLLAFGFAIALLLLAWSTTHNICYDQLGSKFVELDNASSNDCYSHCDGDVASKKSAFINDPQTAALSRKQFDEEDSTSRIKRIVKCSWANPTNRFFRTFARSVVLWVFFELFLAAKRKYPFSLNLILVLIIALGVPTAIYQLQDIQNRTCSPITFSYDVPSEDTICSTFVFDSSFVLTIALMVLLTAQLFYNIFTRGPRNEEQCDRSQGTSPNHDNISQETNPAYNNIGQGNNHAHDNIALIESHNVWRF